VRLQEVLKASSAPPMPSSPVPPPPPPSPPRAATASAAVKGTARAPLVVSRACAPEATLSLGMPALAPGLLHPPLQRRGPRASTSAVVEGWGADEGGGAGAGPPARVSFSPRLAVKRERLATAELDLAPAAAAAAAAEGEAVRAEGKIHWVDPKFAS
jgi:hypothetical protein